MARPGVSMITPPRQVIPFFLLLLFLLPILGACSSPGYPRYQPKSVSYKWWSFDPIQGYRDFQIDEQTYLILYENYFYVFPKDGLMGRPLQEQWLRGAQEYVLYRAGELAKAKGAKYFIALHKDDWNIMYIQRNPTRQRDQIWRARRPNISPGAGMLIRIFHTYPSAISKTNERLYEVDRLLQSLVEKNIGLAEYQGDVLKDLPLNTGEKFSRWRSSVRAYDEVSTPEGITGVAVLWSKPGTKTIPLAQPGEFEIAMWSSQMISPIQFLLQCVELADREQHEAFKLMNWTVEEYRTDGKGGDWKVWFRVKANIVLQHQKELDSLDPQFMVNEIRQNVNSIRRESLGW